MSTAAISTPPSVLHSTYTIERTYAATPERVFAALSDPAKKRRWFAGDAADSCINVIKNVIRNGIA